MGMDASEMEDQAKMNVLRIMNQVTDKYMTEETLKLGEGLSLKGGRLIVASTDAGLINILEQSSIKCYYIPGQLLPVFTLNEVISKLKDIVRNEGIDIIEAMDDISAVQGFFVSRGTGKDFITNFLTRRITWMDRVIGWGKCVVVPTKEAGRQLIEAFRVPHHRLRFIPLGIKVMDGRTPQYQIPGADKTISVLLNPLNIEENNLDIVRIISRVSKFIPDVKAVIFLTHKKGEKKCREHFLHMIKRYDAARVVRIVEPYGLHSEELYQSGILLLNDCADITNLRFLIEAGGRGTAVIARKERGALDIINDGENGLLVSWEDERTIVNTLLRILRDRKLAGSLAQNMKAYVIQEYAHDRTISLRLNLYDDIISAQKILVTEEEDNISKIITLCSYLRAVKERFPRARIAVLGETKYRDIFKSQGGVDEVITRTKKYRGVLRRRYTLIKMLQREYYDIGINVREDRFSRLFLSLVCARRIYHKREIPMSQEAGFLLEISQSDKNYIEEFLSDEWVGAGQGIMGLNIGREKREIKTWGLENFIRLSDEAARHFSLRTVLTGSQGDLMEAAEFVRLSRTRPINAVGKTGLMELAALINRCCLYVTTDTLPLYIACAVDTPTIAISGPTDPRAALSSLNNLVVVRKAMRCSPCNRKRCSDPACIYTITPEDVLECIKKLNICSTAKIELEAG